MAMHVQEFLRAGGTLEKLTARYAIKATRGRRHPQLVGLKYSQIASPFDEPLVRECRGIVLDEADDWRCVARGFDKFFNHGEPNAAAIDWATAVVQEKLDGSLCMAYCYRDEWYVATTGTPDGAGRVNETPSTFAELFWRTFDAQGLRREALDPAWTWCFELCAPENRVVVRHAGPTLTLLMLRNPETGEELRPNRFPQGSASGGAIPQSWGPGGAVAWPLVREFPLGTIEAILASFAALDPLQQEGYVVVDALGRRVKVKHPGYVALAYLKETMSERALLEVVRSGEVPELLSAFPELTEKLAAVTAAYDELVAEIEADYARLQAIVEQKEFAVAAGATVCPPALFALRSGKAPSVRAFLAVCGLPQFQRLMAGRA